MANDDYITIRIRKKTHPRMKLLAAITQESMIDLIDRLVREELLKVEKEKR